MALVFAIERPDGTHQRIETGAIVAFDQGNDEVVMPFKNVMTAESVLRLLIGTVRREAERSDGSYGVPSGEWIDADAIPEQPPSDDL